MKNEVKNCDRKGVMKLIKLKIKFKRTENIMTIYCLMDGNKDVIITMTFFFLSVLTDECIT